MSPPHADAPAPRSGTHSLLRLVATLVLLGASLAVAGQARAADLNATPSTLSSVYASAQGGDVIHLAAGSYGNFAGGSKASVVTLVAQPGATATISPNLGSGVSNLRFDGLTIDGVYTNGARNVAFVNSKFTGLVRVDTPANVSAANILFDHDTFDGLSATATSYEGRLTVRGYDNSAPVGVKITNSHFGNGGCSDGVQIIGGAYGVEVGPGNEFSGIQQGACAPHVDSIQLYGSSHTQIVGNYFHDRRHDHHGPRRRRERVHRRQRDDRRRLRARRAVGQSPRQPVRAQHRQEHRRAHGPQVGGLAELGRRGPRQRLRQRQHERPDRVGLHAAAL